MNWFLKIITLGIPSIIGAIARARRAKREQVARLEMDRLEASLDERARFMRFIKRIAGAEVGK